VDVVLTKADAPDGHDRTLLVSSDGAKRVAVHVIHDLPHLVVESVFGITDGLWGELARGEHVDAGRAACARSAGRRKLGRIVSGAASGASTNMWLSDGHRLAKAVTNAVVNRGQDGPDTPDGVRARLSKDAGPASAELLGSVNDATIQLAIDGVHRVYEQWAQTPPGESLRLSWPLPPGFRELAERA
jgi:hypothetical protein